MATQVEEKASTLKDKDGVSAQDVGVTPTADIPGRIETERLVLRQLQEEDFESIATLYGNEDVARNISFLEGRARSRETARRFFDWFRSQQTEPRKTKDVYDFAITDRKGYFIGHTMLFYHQEDDRDIFERVIYLSPQYWKQGYATETQRALMEFGFGKLGLQKIYATAALDNVGSQLEQVRSGMVPGGQKDVQMGQTGVTRNSLYFESTPNVWAKFKQENIQAQQAVQGMRFTAG